MLRAMEPETKSERKMRVKKRHRFMRKRTVIVPATTTMNTCRIPHLLILLLQMMVKGKGTSIL